MIQHRCALLDRVSMLCNKCLGGDEPGDASTHNNNVLQPSFVLLDVPCEASLCTRSVFESTVDAESQYAMQQEIGNRIAKGMPMYT